MGYEMANSWFDPPLVRAARQRRGAYCACHGPQALRPRHFIATHSLLEPQLIRTNCALCEPTDAEKFPAAEYSQRVWSELPPPA